VSTKRSKDPFRDPLGPKLDRRKYRNRIVKQALESCLTNETTIPRHRAAARSLLGEIARLERERPDTTVCGMLALKGDTVSIWAYEPELAPIGNTRQIVIDATVALNHAIRTLRSS
jgi:hypothetical protein